MKKKAYYGTILTLIAIIAALVAGIAYAKLSRSSEPEDAEVVVARWSFKVNGVEDNSARFSLTNTINENGHAKEGYVAPGTNGYFDIELDGRGSEVAINYIIKADFEGKPDNMNFYLDEDHTIEVPLENKSLVINDFIPLDQINEKKLVRVYWDWPLDTGNTEEEIFKNNIKDTEAMGNDMTIDLTVSGIQTMPNAPTADYNVYVYLENAEDNNYTLYTQTTIGFTEKIDSKVTLSNVATRVVQNLGGDFKYSKYAYGKIDPNGEKVTNITIAEDNSTEIYLYFERERFTLTTIAGNNVEEAKSIGTATGTSNDYTENEYVFIQNRKAMVTQYKWGETVTITASMGDDENYNAVFTGWSVTENNGVLPNLGGGFNSTNSTTTIVMPREAVEVTANGTKEGKPFNYTVNYYYNNEIDEEKTVTIPSRYNEQITTYTEQEKDGYVLDRVTGTPLRITNDETANVINVYYKLREYTIEYDLDGGALPENTTNPRKYTMNSANITINNPEKENYLFAGWTGGVVDEEGEIDDEAETGTTGNITEATEELIIQTGSKGNRKYTANWKEKGYVVTIHHYLEGTGPAYNNEAIEVADDETLTNQVLGALYSTRDLMPQYDEDDNLIQEPGRVYLDEEEVILVGNSGNTTGFFTEDEIEVTYYYRYIPAIRIVSSPVAALEGTEYGKISFALKALEDNNLTNASELTEMEVLRNIKNESSVVSNKNVELNLAGYEVKSLSEENPTITVDNSKLTIVDESEVQSGKVVSENKTAVYVKTDAEFVFGRNVKPVMQTPEIIGEENGVEMQKLGENQEIQGTFKFYDGKITGTIAIEGILAEVPVGYESSVNEVPGETGKQFAVLGIPTDKEARIGTKFYKLLENAILDANDIIGTPEEQVEIVLVRDLEKTAKVVVDSDKNIKLNLDGHTLTNNVEDYVIENAGKLEIVDSTVAATEDYIYDVVASDSTKVNIVNGYTRNWNGLTVLLSGDCNFNFTTQEEGYYKLKVEGRFINYGMDVYVDNVLIGNYNNGYMTSDTLAELSLGNIEPGTHTLRLYTSGYTPYITDFHILGDSTGKIVSTTYDVINNISYEIEEVKTYEQADFESDAQYKFIPNGNKMVSNNNGRNSTTANSYIEIDLTGLDGDYIVDVNAEISSEADYDYGYATITKSATNIPAHNLEAGRFIHIAGTVGEQNYQSSLAGGSKYYLHLGYYKDSGTHRGDDIFTINSVKLYKASSPVLKLSSGKVAIEKNGTSSNYRSAIKTYGDVQLAGGNLTSSKEYTKGIDAYSCANITVQNTTIDGNFDAITLNDYSTLTMAYGTISGSRGIVNNSVAATAINITGGTVIGTADDAIENNANTIINISNAQIKSSKSSRCGIDDQSTDGKLNISSSTISGYYGIYIANKTFNADENTFNAEIINSTLITTDKYGLYVPKGKAKVTGGSIDGVYSYPYGGKSYIQANNATITNTVTLENNSTADFNNCNINCGVSIKDNTNTINFNNCIVRGYISNASGTININGGEYTRSSGNIISNSATVYIDGGVEITATDGIAVTNGSDGHAYLYDAEIKSEGNNYAVESRGQLDLGKNDGTINQEKPLITSAKGVNITGGTFNFYDGTITANIDNVITGDITEIPEGAVLISTIEDNKESITVGPPTIPVAKIGENTYTTLEAAIAAVPENGATATKIELLQDIYALDTYVIPENKKVQLDVGANRIKYLTNSYMFNNAGEFELGSNFDWNDLNVDLSQKIDKGTYGFTYNEVAGTLTSTNKGVNNSYSECYIPIDLTTVNAVTTLKVNYTISSEGNYDIGYLYLTNSIDTPSYSKDSNSPGRIMYASGSSTDTASCTVNGGSIYYLHCIYYKDASTDKYNDEFIINGISIESGRGSVKTNSNQDVIKSTNKLKLTNLDINCSRGGTSSRTSIIIDNSGELELSNAVINANYSYTTPINNTEVGTMVLNNATINCNIGIISSSSGDTHIINATLATIVNNGSGDFTIDYAKTYIYSGASIANNSTGNIIINNGSYESYINEPIANTSTGTITVNAGTYQGRNNTIRVDNGKITVNGGTHAAYEADYNTVNNGGELVINGGSLTAIQVSSAAGKLTINGGTVSHSRNAIVNNGTFIMTGGTITTNVAQTYYSDSEQAAILNNKTMRMTGGTVDGKGVGIYNGSTYDEASNTGGLVITGGNIKGTDYTGITSIGTLTIGEKGGVPDQLSPNIIGGNYGVNVGSSEFNYYDGRIEGKTSQSILGTPTNLEPGYEPIITAVEGKTVYEQTTLGKQPIATVVSTGSTPYYSLNDAIAACQETDEIDITRSASILADVDSVVIPAESNITLDLNGYNIVAGNETTFSVLGNLSIIDSSTEKTGILQNSAYAPLVLSGSGNLNVTETTIQATSENSAIINNGTGNITINSANINGNTVAVIKNNGNGTAAGNVTLNNSIIQCINQGATVSGVGIEMNDGALIVNNTTITTNGTAIDVKSDKPTVTVNSGTIGTGGNGIVNNDGAQNVSILAGTYGKIYNKADGKITIGVSDRSATAPTTGIMYNKGTGDLLINNVYAEYKGEVLYNTGNGNIIINYATLKGIDIYSRTTLIDNTSGTLTINDGNFNVSRSTVIYNRSAGTVNINGGTYVAQAYWPYSGSTLENYGTATILAGTLEAKDETCVKNYGTLTLGDKNGPIDNSLITIKGSSAGVYTDGTFNYYNGTIIGPINNSINGLIADIATNKETLLTIDTLETTTINTTTNVAKIGNTEYTTLKEAMATCSTSATEPTTIEIIANVGLGGANYEILNGQNIILDLAGNIIDQHNSWRNNGTFEIADSSQDGTGKLYIVTKLISSPGNFKISGGNIISYINYAKDNVNYIDIIDNGKFTITGGYIYVYNGIGHNYNNTINVVNIASPSDVDLLGGTIEVKGVRYSQGGATTNNVVSINNTGVINKVNVDGFTSRKVGSDGQTYNIKVQSGGNIDFKMDSGTLNAGNDLHYSGRINSFVMNGGLINYVNTSDNVGSAIVNGGTINTARLKCGSSNGKVEINGGTINDAQISAKEVIINDITNTTSVGITANNKVEINGGTMKDVTIQNSSSASAITDRNYFTMTGGTINNYLSLEYTKRKGLIGNETPGKDIAINGRLLITGKNSNTLMTKGTINNTSGQGVTINEATATFTLGTKEYPVSTTEPSITGNTIGVNRADGTFNFYDGILIGGERALQGGASDTPELYSVVLNEGETEATLGIVATLDNVADMNGSSYKSLALAIQTAQTTPSYITLKKNVVLTETLNINEGQNITIDLAGSSIRLADADKYTINNAGTLTIIDSTASDNEQYVPAVVKNVLGTAIKNSGVLTIGKIEEEDTIYSNSPQIIGKTCGIDNSGTVNMNDGRIQAENNVIAGTEVVNIPDGSSVSIVNETVNGVEVKILKFNS